MLGACPSRTSGHVDSGCFPSKLRHDAVHGRALGRDRSRETEVTATAECGGTGEVLRALGIPEAKVADEVAAMRDPVVAPTNDRRVLGSMNDFAFMTEAYAEDHPLMEVALKLAEAPCSPLGMNNPREATMAAFSMPLLRLVR